MAHTMIIKNRTPICEASPEAMEKINQYISPAAVDDKRLVLMNNEIAGLVQAAFNAGLRHREDD